jgi:2',3'-cyclic-nucleotide 2'-phosphodiesterase (5'-nucleotidase family)
VLDIADVYLKTFRQTGLAALTIGDRDLALGIKPLRALAKKASFPFLSANIVDSGGKPVFQAATIVKAAGYKVGIVGATTTLFVNRRQIQEKNGIQVVDPVEPVAKAVAKVKKSGAQLVILLSHLNQSELDRVLKGASGIHVVLGGQDTRMQHALDQHGETLSANGFFRGKYVSVSSLYVKSRSFAFVDRNRGSALSRRKSILESQLRSRELSLERARKNPKGASRVEVFQRLIVQIKTELQTLTMDIEDLKAPDPKASFIDWKLAPLGKQIVDDAAVAQIVTAYRKVHPDPKKRRKAVGPRPIPSRPIKPPVKR